MDTPAADPTRRPVELGDVRLAAESMQSLLHRVADLAVATVPGVAEASVTVMERTRAHTVAGSGLLAYELDEAQYGLNYGPCLFAATSGQPVLIRDLATETRWPEFCRLASRQGAVSTCSVPILIVHELQAGLNDYSTDQPLDEESRAAALDLAGVVAVTISNMHALERANRTVGELQEAIASRAVIEQAKGVLMVQLGLSADEAFTQLSRRSQNTNRKLRDIAVEVVDGVLRGS